MKTETITKMPGWLFAGILSLALLLTPTQNAGAMPAIAGMGDSIGEGVQANDAAWQTQVNSYLNWISYRMGGDLTIPYIRSNYLGMTQDTQNRSRVYPSDINSNVAVSGADLADLLNSRANAGSVAAIDDELDLVMFPRQQTQMEWVESVAPGLILCWIGNNDALGAAITFDNLDASQLTPVADFDRDYIVLANRLDALRQVHGSRIVLANIPDVTDIGFLLDRATVESITGFPVDLPDGYFTSIIAAFLMSVVGNDNLMADPSFVLDAAEVVIVKNRIQTFNGIIQREADRIGVPVVDINAKFADIIANPPVFFGRPLTKNILGGVFSHDGVHPSNIGHALVANEFIRVMNDFYGMNVPELSPQVLEYIYLNDPNVDKDFDGKAVGRPGVGLIESLFYVFGLTGDTNDSVPN